MVSAIPVLATVNARGFDTNAVVSSANAARFVRAGYTFCLRYVPRLTPRANDLTVTELSVLLAAGLAVMPVQHVESASSWLPDPDKGARYGETAAEYATTLGFPAGVTVWLDLEGVSSVATDEAIIGYCNRWFDVVASAGMQPGLYVGWHARLSATQLYRRLKFTRYWGAYNSDGDQTPLVRGWCMKQSVGAPPVGVPFPIDVNTIVGDQLGGLPVLAASRTDVPIAA